MSYCHNCDRFVAVPVTIQGKPYCCRCAVDYPDEDEYSHDDEITRRIDAVLREDDVSQAVNSTATGNLNSAEPCSRLGAKSEQRVGTCCFDEATGEYVMAGDFTGDEELRWQAPAPTLSVPLAEQIAQYGDRCEEVLDALHTNLEDEWFRTEVIRLGAQRLIENYGECIDRMYHWSADVRDKNMMEEAADYVCYGTSGPFFNTRSAR